MLRPARLAGPRACLSPLPPSSAGMLLSGLPAAGLLDDDEDEASLPGEVVVVAGGAEAEAPAAPDAPAAHEERCNERQLGEDGCGNRPK